MLPIGPAGRALPAPASRARCVRPGGSMGDDGGAGRQHRPALSPWRALTEVLNGEVLLDLG